MSLRTLHTPVVNSTTLLLTRRALAVSCRTKADVHQDNLKVKLPTHHALVVGGTSGIGEGIAKRLAKAHVNVTIVGRDAKRGAEIVQQLEGLGGSQHQFQVCDSFSMKNIQDFCTEYRQTHASLDFLVLTQGIATMQGRTETKEGLDQKLALHYFGRMAYIHGLLPVLRQSGHQAKVMSVLSGGYNKPYPFSLIKEDFELRKNYSLSNAATAAGQYNDLGLDALSKDPENAKILFAHAYPGFVRTRWGSEFPTILRAGIRVLQHFAKTTDECAESLCHPLFHSNLTGFTHVFENGDIHKVSATEKREQLDFIYQKTMDIIQKK